MRPRRRRAGFTLLEMTVSMALLLAILGMTTQLFRRQANALSVEAGRLDAQQNGRFSLTSLERELRVAGIGVVDAQPILVQAAPLAITFNADLVTRTPGDAGAVYFDPEADSMATSVFQRGAALPLVTSTRRYPDSTYYKSAGVPSGAETIAFWLSRDSTSAASNEYVLFRRVNALPAHVVAAGVVVNPTDTVFQYFIGDTLGTLSPVALSKLPLIHTAALHGATNDTGRFALVDSIRTVRVRMTTVFHDPRNGDIRRRLDATIRLMNSGMARGATCGESPVGVVPAAVATPANVGLGVLSPYVTITWPRALDDGGGERDVERYAIYRRPVGQPQFLEPFASVPAGETSYSFRDTDVTRGQSWIYGVAAQDCSPASSPVGQTGTIVVP